VNNQMFMALVAAVLMLLIFPTLFGRPVAGTPRGTTNFFEAILQFLRDEVFRPALKEHTDRFVPFLWTMFFFILFCNLLGTIPLAEIIFVLTGKQHVGGTATGSLSTTGALAVCAFVFIHVSGMVQVARDLIHGVHGHHGPQHGQPAEGHGAAAAGHHGMFAPLAIVLAPWLYLWNFAPHPFKPGPGQAAVMWLADVPFWLMLLVLELLGALIKPFALAMRLFANMIGGHIVLAVLLILIPTTGIIAQLGAGLPVTVLSLLMYVLELFVAFLQAYIFTFLTTLFIASAVAPEH